MEDVDWEYNNRDFNLYDVQFTSSDESIAKAGINLGSSTYAPTAANIAEYLVDKNKAVAYESIDPAKLQPGDLIFYGSVENGRYLGISHVAIFEGNVSYYSW